MNPAVFRYAYRGVLAFLFTNMLVQAILGDALGAWINLAVFLATLWAYRVQRLRGNI